MKDNIITVIVNDDVCDNMTLISSNINVNFVGEGKENLISLIKYIHIKLLIQIMIK